jgi:hypothetical protein
MAECHLPLQDIGILLDCTQIKFLAAFTVGFGSAQPTRDLRVERSRNPMVG